MAGGSKGVSLGSEVSSGLSGEPKGPELSSLQKALLALVSHQLSPGLSLMFVWLSFFNGKPVRRSQKINHRIDVPSGNIFTFGFPKGTIYVKMKMSRRDLPALRALAESRVAPSMSS